ncbi:type I-E CRISPR-associated protein Cas6/Cse3/CasE [Thiocystis violascens]|uniref:CRISPR-associated protein Cas6/Cse3/CasE, subtype I-E/ECOLI n=1 Tax=Thiocystis violascens (strain ATCC 17096 / DSM 198 / 6111) TaxID=765911 RepID=I3Y7Y7_THIV6|nr:type I-E CRISPR-associated protein Cas6/Cse3/CasE [Thiocystis violascens]AFL73105.1 CRISPR-associated protein Cas6/Cse3/CasE, subtype I-E/ECOLI [Thiocystis violascens DSM 198]
MSLYLLHCSPDPEALAIWATRHRLLSPDGDDGYALHALLTAAFGEQSPKPFRYLGARQGLLAYSDQPPALLHDNAALATPDVARALGLNSLAVRAFPTTWANGQMLSFEVRVRPIVRPPRGPERDLFQYTAEQSESPEKLKREVVYVDWLRQKFAEQDAAELSQVSMDAFRLSRVIRRTGTNDQGQRQALAPSGPDAVFKGQLRVGESDAFARLLKRGIGRHRAFGFGMLLLKPAHSC